MTKASWLYYVVDHAWVARISHEGVEAQLLKPDGCWEPFGDVWKVCVDGRRVASEEEALEEARKVFELRGQPHALGCSAVDGKDADAAKTST